MDLVYLYCDDSDKIWHEKRRKYQPQTADPQAVCDGRFIQNDELKFSLRSVAKYLPWIRRIYIVSDNQIPVWLNTEHPKIFMVKHEEIINPEYLPLFNSSAIETGLANIPQLGEYFAYMNDDTFLYRPVSLSDLLNDGKPVCRMITYRQASSPTQYERMILNMQKLAEQTTEMRISYFPHHNLDVYSKKDFLISVNRHRELIAETLSHRFRDSGDWHRSIVNYEALNIGHAQLKVVDSYHESFIGWLKHNFLEFGRKDSLVLSLHTPKYKEKLKRNRPLFFCLEDNEYTTSVDRIRGRAFLEKLFPFKSEFEK